MKGTRGFGPGGPIDLGTIFDEIFEAARDFHDEFRRNFNGCGDKRDEGQRPEGGEGRSWFTNDNTDYYPNYSYPPMNVFMTGDRSLIFEFALAGFEEKDISLSFQGDYMMFQAAVPPAQEGAHPDGSVRYFKRRLKMKDIEKQKYFVPMDKYSQDKVKAVFRNGILKVTIPPKEEPDKNDGVKIEIVTED